MCAFCYIQVHAVLACSGDCEKDACKGGLSRSEHMASAFDWVYFTTLTPWSVK